MSKIIRISRDQVAGFCPDCAKQMTERRVKELKLTVIDPSDPTSKEYTVEAISDQGLAVKTFKGFSEGLCNHFGGEQGFFERAHAVMSKHMDVDDSNRFCSSLKHWCTGQWPGEKAHALTIEKDGASFKVYDANKDLAGIYTTEAKARAFIDQCKEEAGLTGALLYAENDNAVRGVEIFSSGTHNGDEYTETDLDDMVKAFKELDYRPALKIGHTKDKPGSPAFGWITNLRKEGTKLLADFESMHDTVIQALRNRNYDRVSSEIYFNLKRGGNVFRRALKAVALLGAEVPAVAKLVPLHKVEFADDASAEAVFEATGTNVAVPESEYVAALSKRVDALLTLLKENDMAKNAAEIKVLKDQLAKFKTEMDKKKKKDVTDDDQDADYKQLKAEAESLSQKIANLETEDVAADADALRTQLTAANDALAKQQAETKALSERLSRIEHERTNSDIGERVRACKVPAFRGPLQALYTYALAHAGDSVKVYSEKDGKTTEDTKTLAQCIDGIVGEINAQSDKVLFKQFGKTENGKLEEAGAGTAGQEVDGKIKAYRAKHPEVKTYEMAMKAVFAEEPVLAQRWREEFAAQQSR